MSGDRERLNKKIRETIPGGDALLDLLTETHKIKNMKYPGKAGELAVFFHTKLSAIANMMRDAIWLDSD